MKKKVLGSLAVITIAVVTMFNVGLSTLEDGFSSISLANVEALANDENHDVDCSKEGGECTIAGPNGYIIIVKNYQKP